MVEVFESTGITDQFNTVNLADNFDTELEEKKQKDELEREGKIQEKIAEEMEKKKERIEKGKAEFDAALKYKLV